MLDSHGMERNELEWVGWMRMEEGIDERGGEGVFLIQDGYSKWRKMEESTDFLTSELRAVLCTG